MLLLLLLLWPFMLVEWKQQAQLLQL